MAVLGEHGLVTLWERIKRYVRWYVDENFPIASVSKIGGIRPDNNTVTVEPNGTLHARQTPIATTDTAGKVIPDGTTIAVDEDGVIHGVEQYVLPVASGSWLGGVRIREDGYIGIDDGYLYLKCDVADSDVVDSYTKDDSGEAIPFPGGSVPTYLIDYNTLRRLWENVTEYVQENSDTGELESGLSIRNYTESNDLYRFLGNVLKTVTVIPWTAISGSGTFTTDDSMGTSYEYALVCDGKCYFDAPTEYGNGKRLWFNLPNNERVVIGITGSGSSRTLSVTCTDGEDHQIMLVRFQELGTADLNNNVGGVGFLMRNEYATTSRAGVVKVGSGLVVGSDGTLSVDMTNLNEVSF